MSAKDADATRHVRAELYCESFLMDAAKTALDSLNKLPVTQHYYMFLHAIVSAAFSMEAYLNRIGTKLFPFWPEIERKLSPLNKLKIICWHLKFSPDYSRSPYQSLTRAFAIRTLAAHAKPESKEVEERVIWGEDYIPPYVASVLESKCTETAARRIVEDIEQIARDIQHHQKSGDILPPMGVRSELSTRTVPDPEAPTGHEDKS